MGAKRKTTMKNGPKLLIVESPAKIKTISKFLGPDFKIMSTFGHIMDLPSRKLGITIDDKTHAITLEYVPIKDKASVIADICKQASKSSEVYLASDPDREGEIISWHIGKQIEKVFADDTKIYRISFNEITKPAVMEAIENKTEVDINKVNAQQARRILDRWVGYEVSPILWKKLAKGLSAGRVQSVAVLVICNREAEILNFKPEESWSIEGLFGVNKEEFSAELFKINNKAVKLKNKQEADEVLAVLQKEQYSITSITEKERSKKPSAPFMTSTLQQDAFNKLGFSVKKTMTVAQKLYEGLPLSDKNKPEALITYMRTDSVRISDTALKQARDYIKSNFGSDYCPKTAIPYGSKGSTQDAHEAIRPINIEITPDIAKKYLTPEQAKLYGLIWKRFVACQMTSALYFQRQVLLDGGKFTFKATGSTLIFDGFLKVYMEEDEEEKTTKIPKDIKEKDAAKLKKIDPKQHFTQPPPRYSEATLVKELEKQGVGRPSTYATILSTIETRGYVSKDKKRFVPTELGKAVNEMLTKNLPDIINITFTAKMEEDLDKIAQGDVDRDKVLHEFYDKFKKDLVTFGGQEASRKAVETDLKCPDCGAPLFIRFGKSGEFVGCSKYPDCKFTSNFARNENGELELRQKTETEIASNLACPNCGSTLIKRVGRYGPFLSCPGYPDCKYIHQEQLKMPCPQCGGNLVKRRWKGGSFWGCSGYPKCRFSIFGEVKEESCPHCKAPYMLVTRDKEGNEKLSCPNKECGHIEEKKL